MRIGYADPPYPGLAHLYRDHPDYAGEVDHATLIARLEAEFDGWILHTHAPGIAVVAPLLPEGARWGAWVKTFCCLQEGGSPRIRLGAGDLQAVPAHGRRLLRACCAARLDRLPDDDAPGLHWCQAGSGLPLGIRDRRRAQRR